MDYLLGTFKQVMSLVFFVKSCTVDSIQNRNFRDFYSRVPCLEEEAGAIPEVPQKRDEVGRVMSAITSAPDPWNLDPVDCISLGCIIDHG